MTGRPDCVHMEEDEKKGQKVRERENTNPPSPTRERVPSLSAIWPLFYPPLYYYDSFIIPASIYELNITMKIIWKINY